MAMNKIEHNYKADEDFPDPVFIIFNMPAGFAGCIRAAGRRQTAGRMHMVNTGASICRRNSMRIPIKILICPGRSAGFACIIWMHSRTSLHALSKIAYVEILDKNNRPVLQEKISLKPGESHGSLIIPASISSGTYIFRAYTSWMKNFGPEYYFEKAIRIINPHKLEPDSSYSKNKEIRSSVFSGRRKPGAADRIESRIPDNRCLWTWA